MLNLLLGKDWVENREAILRQVAEDVRAGRGGRVLMVPELISHDTERRLCAAAGDTTSRYAEVMSFTMLARRVSEQVGSAARECMDGGGRVVAMAAAARQLHSRLKAYAAVETRPEFLTELVDAVDEFKRCCITGEDLLSASRQTEGSLAQKLEELSLLMEAYDSLCARGKRDPADQMTWLLEQLEAGNFAQNHVFYIDGFPDFTRQHLAILEHLIAASADVTVSLTCRMPGDTALAFQKAGDTAAQLIRCARRRGVQVSVRTIGEAESPLQAARERLFQGKTTPIPGLKGRMLPYRVDTVPDECLAAAQRVLELVRGGCRFRDISVVCGDLAAYQDSLSLIFRRSGIPLYLSGKEDILRKSVISAVLSAMDAALGGFQRDEVLRYLKSVLSPVSPDDCDGLDNYAVMWNIQGSRWCEPWTNHPGGLGQAWTEEARARLAALNAARALALEPLMRLRKGFREAVRLSGQVEALNAFLEEIGLARRLSALALELDGQGDNRGAQILSQLWEILLAAMEQLYDVLGETVWDGEVFTRLFSLLLSQYDVGTIPPVLDAVTAGTVSAMRCQQEKHLILLGALEGNLPGYGGSTGVLTDQEREALREMGVPLTGGGLQGLQAEFAEIYGVFCGARETAAVFCPDGEPSYVYRRLADMAGGEERFLPMEAAAAAQPWMAAGCLAAWNCAGAAEELGLGDIYREICRRRDYALGDVSEGNVRALYGQKLNLSASQIDRQADCRLSYFLRYGLRAEERKEATVDPAEFGTYVHAVLEQTAKAVMERGGFHKVSLEETLEFAQAFSDAYAAERFGQIGSKRVAYLLGRNAGELEMIVRELWQELHCAHFQPTAFELDFGDGMTMPAIPISGKKMQAQLRGFVDRVDVWQEDGRNYFRVVDYKTGSKDFDYCDVLNGVGLQMLLYLFALEQNGEAVLGSAPIGAGVQYFPARVPLVKISGRKSLQEAEEARNKQWKRKGLVLADNDVLDAMEPEGSPQRLSCKRGKNGEVSGDAADREQFRQLKAYIFSYLSRMVDEIGEGKVAPNPYTRGSYHNACAYCPYTAVCQGTDMEERRDYKAVKAPQFWEQVGKEREHGG